MNGVRRTNTDGVSHLETRFVGSESWIPCGLDSLNDRSCVTLGKKLNLSGPLLQQAEHSTAVVL